MQTLHVSLVVLLIFFKKETMAHCLTSPSSNVRCAARDASPHATTQEHDKENRSVGAQLPRECARRRCRPVCLVCPSRPARAKVSALVHVCLRVCVFRGH
jgi:hypothetical protein